MIKQKHPLFNKTLSKHPPKQPNLDQLDSKKTRRSYFKLNPNPNNLNTIIKNLQHSVKQLKNFNDSLHKTKMQKSSSLHEINKLRSSGHFRSKQTVAKKNLLKKYQDQNKQNISSNIHPAGIESTVSKNFGQNASTMLSIQNADVDEIKKAYQFTYGRETTNIVDLYNFFRKNADKSLRFNHGSIEMSSLPHVQHSEDLIKSRQNIFHRKSNELLNVIIEDKSEKQLQVNLDKAQKSCSFSISKLSGSRNPTMEEIFKGGCPDLANVYDFVKKRRISLKNYMNFNQNQIKPFTLSQFERKPQTEFKNESLSKIENLTNSKKIDTAEKKENEQNLFNEKLSPIVDNLETIKLKSHSQGGSVQEQKYFPSKSSKKSQKSSLKKSKNKQHNFNLDENIPMRQIDEFDYIDTKKSSPHKPSNHRNQDLNQNVFDFDSFEISNEKNGKRYCVDEEKKQLQSLDGSSISVRSCSRIIELEFIPLDL